MLEISPAKVVHIIFLARGLAGGVGGREISAFIDALNDDEKAHLTALAWVGRGVFDAADFREAVATARREATVPTADYLQGMPHLAENLEAGLDALGIDPETSVSVRSDRYRFQCQGSRSSTFVIL